MTVQLGITGLAQHGKDTIGQQLVDKWGFTRFGFADKLKQLALVVNPLVYTKTPGTELRLSDVVEHEGWDGAKQHQEVRRILQDLGTGARSILDHEVWVQALINSEEYLSAERSVITDVRFVNESYDVTLIGVVRPNFDNGVGLTHDSERMVSSVISGADYVIVNDSSLEVLRRKVDTLMAEVLRGEVK